MRRIELKAPHHVPGCSPSAASRTSPAFLRTYPDIPAVGVDSPTDKAG
jgi:hypothetical protein